MASAKDDNLLSPYRTFLLDLSSKLLSDDLEKLKFACKDVVPYGKTEEVTTGFKFFDLLEQNGKISPQNLTPLENMMEAIRRADLASEVKQFIIGNDVVPDGAQQDAGLQDDNPFNGPAVRQDEGDEDVPDGLEMKADKIMYVAMDQPIGVGSTQNNPCSAGFSNNAPPASALRNGPGTGEPTNKGISPAPRVNRSFNGGTSSGGGGAVAPVVRPSPSKPQLREPKGQGTVQYVNFLVLEGYSVQIVGGKHFSTPDGEFVELKSGTHYKILLKNSHPYACNVDISIDGYDVGGWIMQGDEQLALERSAYEAKKFTFYRVKKAPKDSGIDPSRPEENGVIKCVFTPEAFVDIQVNISGSSQPLTISFAPSATVTVGDLKQKIQQQLSKSPDPNQILAQNNKALKNHMPVRPVIESPGNLVLVDVELDVTVEASTNERFQVKIRPGDAQVIDLMQKIEAEFEVPIKDQKLFHGKTRLSDNPHKDLPEELVYSLNRTVVVIVPDYIEVTVENSASAESITLKIDKEKRLTDLAQEIPSYRNMGNNQEAIFLVDGRELSPVQDTGTLASLGILSGSRVKLVVRVLFIKVVVTGLPQGRLTVQCNPLDTFQDLLNHVQSRLKLKEIGDGTFSTKGRDFNPKKDLDTLKDYGIEHRSILVFKKEEPPSSKDQPRDQRLKEKEEEEEETLGACLGGEKEQRGTLFEAQESSPAYFDMTLKEERAVSPGGEKEQRGTLFEASRRFSKTKGASRRKGIMTRMSGDDFDEGKKTRMSVPPRPPRALTRKGESDPEDGYDYKATIPTYGKCPIAKNSIGESSRVLTTNDPLWRAGGTTLQGHSYQLFEPTDEPITPDPSKKVELVLRLVAREDEPDVKFPTDPCTPLSTLRPPPVPE